MNRFSVLLVLSFSALFLGACGPSGPSGKYSAGFYYANFYEGGKVSFYQASSITATNYSCMTKGAWRLDGDAIVISGLYNPNCSGVSDWNGKVGIEGGIRLYKK